MLIAMITALYTVCAIYFYFDASKHKIGKTPTQKGLYNMSAGAWSLCWLVYLQRRKMLIEKAKEHPVEVHFRPAKAVLLAVTGGLITAFIVIVSLATQQLLTCNTPMTKTTVIGLLEKTIEERQLNVTILDIKDLTEKAYFTNPEATRLCTANIIAEGGNTQTIEYKITWQNKFTDEVFIQINAN